LLVRRSGTHCQMNSEIRRVMSTASNSSLKQSCSALTSVTSALPVIFNVMRSINPRFTYLLTYLQVFQVSPISRPYSTLLIWSGGWLLHGLVCSSMSLTRQSTSGVDGCAPVWELLGDTSNICFNNMKSLFTSCSYLYLMACDVAIGRLCGDFILDDVLYVVKIVANFYKVQ